MAVIINPTVDAYKIVFAEFSGNERLANAIKPIVNASDPITVLSEAAIFSASMCILWLSALLTFFGFKLNEFYYILK